MVFDRGAIKWASLMLPEHVKALREWRDNEKQPKSGAPQLDEQLGETFDQILQEAERTHHPLSITFIKDGKPAVASGVVIKLDPLEEAITLCGPDEAKHRIPTRRIIKIE
jgi:hypothetical protein